MFALWPGDKLNFSIFIKPTFGFAGQPAASEAGHIANTNVGGKFNWDNSATVRNFRLGTFDILTNEVFVRESITSLSES